MIRDDADPEAAPAMTALVDSAPVKRGRILAWSLWDWGSASFNAVATTFVFTVYLTNSKGFGGTDFVSTQLAWTLGIAGLIVAILAPALGRRTDASGSRKSWLAVTTGIVVLCLAGMVFVAPERPYLLLGLLLLGVGTVVFEIGSVNYNAMLSQISTRRTVGAISGFGWGMGYLGGIVLLLIVYFGFIHPDVGLFGVTAENGLGVRVSMLIAAIWFAVFAIPVFLAVPENLPDAGARRTRSGIRASYVALGRDIANLWRNARHTLYFLIASAVFRDGLTGVFTFGGVLAAGTFGFTAGEVIIFAIAANVVAGVATIASGRLDDALGPKAIIVTSLAGILVCGIGIFVFHDGGQIVFWTLGLGLALFVGPAQSASRSYLSRLTPGGRESEMFGLYATTGRVANYLAPLAFGLLVTIGGAQYWGILGILGIIAVGLVLILPVRRPPVSSSTSPATLSS